MLNRKLIIGAVLICALSLQVGCSVTVDQKNSDKDDTLKQQNTVNSTVNAEVAQKAVLDEFGTLISNGAKIAEIAAFVDKNISEVSPENASDMVNKFEKAQKDSLPKLEEKFYAGDVMQRKIAEEYKKGFDISRLDSTKDDELKALLIETKDGGYKVETAEGMFFPIINYEYYKKFEAYVTQDLKDYISIMSVESNKVPAKDAAIVIGWDEVLKRALAQEKFISTYGDSVKADAVKELSNKYTNFVFLGANNTPLFDYNSKTMIAEAKTAYSKAVEEGDGNSPLVRNLKGFLDVLKSNDYKLTDAVDQYRKVVISGKK